jgi:hypothetical protein
MAEIEEHQNQWKVVVVEDSAPVKRTGQIFDIISGFLEKDMDRQLSMEFLDEKDHTFLRGSWNALRLVANSLIEDDDGPHRGVIPQWKDDDGQPSQQHESTVKEPAEIVASFAYAPSLRPNEPEDEVNADELDDVRRAMVEKKNHKAEKKTAKKAKKEAKKAKKAEKKARKEEKKKRKASEV